MKIFLSHSGDIKPFCIRLHDLLKKTRLMPVIDVIDFAAGTSNEKVIQDEIECCDIFLFFATERSIKGKWCLYELELATKSSKCIIPVFFDHPPSLSIDQLHKTSGITFPRFCSEDDALMVIFRKLKVVILCKMVTLSKKIRSCKVQTVLKTDREIIILDDKKCSLICDNLSEQKTIRVLDLPIKKPFTLEYMDDDGIMVFELNDSEISSTMLRLMYLVLSNISWEMMSVFCYIPIYYYLNHGKMQWLKEANLTKKQGYITEIIGSILPSVFDDSFLKEPTVDTVCAMGGLYN